jgi:hypothetical protein
MTIFIIAIFGILVFITAIVFDHTINEATDLDVVATFIALDCEIIAIDVGVESIEGKEIWVGFGFAGRAVAGN